MVKSLEPGTSEPYGQSCVHDRIIDRGFIMRGRKPQPNKIKILKGNPGKRPLNKNEPQPDIVLSECPKWLKGEARAEWKRITPVLYKVGLLTEADISALEKYCMAHARWRQAEAVIEKQKALSTVSGNGEGCSLWCIIAGITLITVPISAHISTTAHCIGGYAGFLTQAAAITFAIALYLHCCGACCLYPFIYAGAVLGVIATLVASIWLSPACILPWGLAVLVFYVGTALVYQAICNKGKYT